jgi:hypothetical protein
VQLDTETVAEAVIVEGEEKIKWSPLFVEYVHIQGNGPENRESGSKAGQVIS